MLLNVKSQDHEGPPQSRGLWMDRSAGLRHRPTVHSVWPIYWFYSSCRMWPRRAASNNFCFCI